MTRMSVFVFAFIALAASAGAQTVAGEWVLTQDVYGNPLYRKLVLKLDGDKLSGTIGSNAIEGTVSGSSVHFVAKTDYSTDDFTGTASGDALSGTVVHTQPDDPKPVKTTWTARRLPQRRSGPPQRHEFTPTTLYREFSAYTKPVLTIWPGDTVHTTTVDAGGTDEKGVTRVLGGNPETGPFYIETAAPGDTLVVHLTRVRLNRDWAESDDFIVGRAVDSQLAVKMKDGGKTVRWHLDAEHGVAMPEKPAEHLTRYSVPLRPMLGCVAVAPNVAQAAPGTGDSGHYGGEKGVHEDRGGARGECAG